MVTARTQRRAKRQLKPHHYERRIKSLCRKSRLFHNADYEFSDPPSVTITWNEGNVTHTAPTWEELHSYIRKLVNPDSRI